MALIPLGFGFLVVTLNLAFASPWNCGDAQWVTDPSLEDGLFSAQLRGECKLDAGNHGSLSGLRDHIRSTIEAYSVLTVPLSDVTYQGMPGWKLTAKHTIVEGPLELEEDIRLVTDGSKRLIYETTSKKIEGDGMAGYLKWVSFRAVVRKELDHFNIHFSNGIRVERPWYALAPLFYLIAKGISRDKFADARDKVLQHIASGL